MAINVINSKTNNKWRSSSLENERKRKHLNLYLINEMKCLSNEINNEGNDINGKWNDSGCLISQINISYERESSNKLRQCKWLYGRRAGYRVWLWRRKSMKWENSQL